MADAHWALEPEGVDGGQDVSPETGPVEVQVRWHAGFAVPTKIERQRVETGPETVCQWTEHSGVEAGRVNEEGRRPVTPEVVQGQDDAVGGRGSSGRHSRAG
jgi:hypothetical protein